MSPCLWSLPSSFDPISTWPLDWCTLASFSHLSWDVTRSRKPSLSPETGVGVLPLAHPNIMSITLLFSGLLICLLSTTKQVSFLVSFLVLTLSAKGIGIHLSELIEGEFICEEVFEAVRRSLQKFKDQVPRSCPSQMCLVAFYFSARWFCLPVFSRLLSSSTCPEAAPDLSLSA